MPPMNGAREEASENSSAINEGADEHNCELVKLYDPDTIFDDDIEVGVLNDPYPKEYEVDVHKFWWNCESLKQF